MNDKFLAEYKTLDKTICVDTVLQKSLSLIRDELQKADIYSKVNIILYDGTK
jgi:hypothetical protein